MSVLVIFPVIFPLICGAVMLCRAKSEAGESGGEHTESLKSGKKWIIELLVIWNSIATIAAVACCYGKTYSIPGILDGLFLFKIDGLGALFAVMISLLWPLATLYGFSYMSHEERQNTFFAWYLATFGITVGVAFSGNLLTMYLFYEFLTLITLPLVMHTMTAEAKRAGLVYILYSLTGAALAFISTAALLYFGSKGCFVYGGILQELYQNNELLFELLYLAGFLGFGVKAALFPFSEWLPIAGVAPVPVTALLHAVAVVKSGVFAVIRLTYYGFGADCLKDSHVSSIVMILAGITVIYGSTKAVREMHLKRRLAYSTVSNLSYILMGAACMSPAGLTAALCHMLFHAIAKIGAFFSCGSVMHFGKKTYVDEMEGLGFRMPATFLTMFVFGLSLAGIPGFAGFVSKWRLGMAAFDTLTWKSLWMMGILAYSAVMTVIYLISVCVRAFVRQEKDAREERCEADWQMLVPISIFAVALIVLGIYHEPVLRICEMIASGLL